jgi:hypothetical protein
MDDLNKMLERIRDSANALNKVSDESSLLVSTWEDFLTKERVPLFNISLMDNGLTLSFKRENKKVRLMVSAGDRPWSECDRRVKLKAIQLLPKFLVHFTEETEKAIQLLVSSAEESVQSLRQALPIKS